MAHLSQRLVDAVSAFACRDDREREWLLEMHRRFESRTAVGGALFAGTMLLCLPWLGPSALFLMGGGLAFAVADRVNAGSERPQRLILGWLAAQGVLALAIAMSGRVGNGDLALLLIPVIGASGGFQDRVVWLCAGFTGLLMVGIVVLADPGLALADPPTLLLPLGLLATTAVLTSAVRRSSIENHDAALIDPLTGMLNRLALGARTAELEQQSALTGQPVAVLALDIDHFKAINDDLGHPVGDAVLSEVAYRIRASLRSYDLAYRMGGEEFAVLLPGATMEHAISVARDIVSAIRGEEIMGRTVTISVGIASSEPGTALNFDAVFGAADAALYRAKAGGRDRVTSTA